MSEEKLEQLNNSDSLSTSASFVSYESNKRHYNGSWESSVVYQDNYYVGLQYYSDTNTYSNYFIAGFQFPSTIGSSTAVTFTLVGDAVQNVGYSNQRRLYAHISRYNPSLDVDLLAYSSSSYKGYNDAVYNIPYDQSSWTSGSRRTFTFTMNSHMQFNANETYYVVFGTEENWPDWNTWFGVITVEITAGENPKATITTHPTGRSLTYTGSIQSLCTQGSASGGTMQYKVEGGSYSSSIPTATNIGTYTVYYYALGDASHRNSDVYSVSTTIGKKSVTIPSLSTTSYTYTGRTISPSFSYDSSWSTLYSGGSGTNVGTYSARFVLDNSNLQWTDGTTADKYITWYITKANQSAPSASGATVTYPNTATATASGGGGQGSIEWSNGYQRSAIGSQNTQARWSGNSNYNASSWSNTVTLTVNRQNTATASALSPTYNGSSQTGVTGSNVTWSGTTSAVNAETYTAYATPNSGYAWSNGGTEQRTITWTMKPSPTATAAAASKTYNGSAQTGVSGSRVAWTGTTSATNSGTYTAYATPVANYAWSDGTTTKKTITWYIYKLSVSVPYLETTSYNYTGNTITPNFIYDSSHSTKGGTYSAISAGTYTATFSLDSSNYKWADDTTANKSISWKINRVTGATYSATNRTYNGSYQYCYTSSSYVLWSGNFYMQDAGSYTATATPDSNHTWSDGTTGAKTVNWSITKATGYISITPTTLSLKYPGSSTGMVNITSSHGGEISVSHTSGDIVATVTHTSSQITFTPSRLGHGYYTVTSAATKNYEAASADVAITVTGSNVTVTYQHKDLSSGSLLGTTTSTEVYGSTITLSTYKKTYTGYTYHHAENSSGVTITTAVVGQNQTYYLYYALTQYRYTVNYNANGGTGTMTPSVVVSSDNTVTITFKANEFTFQGKHWDHWFYIDGQRSVTASSYTFTKNYSNQSLDVYVYWVDDYTYKVYISDGTGWKQARPYISNGSSWKEALPYISNGSGWK